MIFHKDRYYNITILSDNIGDLSLYTHIYIHISTVYASRLVTVAAAPIGAYIKLYIKLLYKNDISKV